jgi:alpha-D-ribose 1-methylphosphonate 5-triphosphate synthase subunit PhnL
MHQVLKISGLGKDFHIHELNKRIKACHSVDLDVYEGEFVGITGKSGSGKSTILRMIYRSYRPQDGTIEYNSPALGLVDLTKVSEREILYIRKYELGYVSQFLNVIPRVSARQIVESALLEKGEKYEKAAEATEEIFKHFEISPTLWDSYPRLFSGGEKLRLNIARAMVTQPRLLLLDEPTASLDQHTKSLVRLLLEKLKASGTTILGIFHDLEFMEGLCDREYAMHEGVFSL